MPTNSQPFRVVFSPGYVGLRLWVDWAMLCCTVLWCDCCNIRSLHDSSGVFDGCGPGIPSPRCQLLLTIMHITAALHFDEPLQRPPRSPIAFACDAQYQLKQRQLHADSWPQRRPARCRWCRPGVRRHPAAQPRNTRGAPCGL